MNCVKVGFPNTPLKFNMTSPLKRDEAPKRKVFFQPSSFQGKLLISRGSENNWEFRLTSELHFAAVKLIQSDPTPRGCRGFQPFQIKSALGSNKNQNLSIDEMSIYHNLVLLVIYPKKTCSLLVNQSITPSVPATSKNLLLFHLSPSSHDHNSMSPRCHKDCHRRLLREFPASQNPILGKLKSCRIWKETQLNSYWTLTLLGTNISSEEKKGTFEDDFPFLQVGYVTVVRWRVIICYHVESLSYPAKRLFSTQVYPVKQVQ